MFRRHGERGRSKTILMSQGFCIKQVTFTAGGRACVELRTAAEGFVEEFAGDTGRGTGLGMLGNEDCIRDGTLELS